jgi:sugar/nucleoside kinase (ribokinase family)
MTDSVQLLGISNAIVDVLAHVDSEFLASIGAEPGSMTLIDQNRADEIYNQMGPATEMSGGSVANTVAGFANLGGTAAYIGKVRDDQLGRIFNHDMQSLGVDIRLAKAAEGAPTARSHVLITRDGQRTMQTYLGACLELGLADITAETVGAPRAILLEGYVWDIAEGPALARKAIDIARRNGTAVALSLSDSFCVERHRDSFEEFVRDGVDIVVADEDEVNALVECRNFDDTLAALDDFDNLFAITRSAKGSVIVHGDEKVVQPAAGLSREQIVDTTGAGDAYCAGFLFGWANDLPLSRCAQYGTYCATRVIQQLGARIEPGVLDGFESL